MKNIHLIPTDKPTGIFKSGDNLLFSIMNKVRTNNEGFHIYITSNKEIKIGDWTVNLNSLYAHKELCRIDNQLELERYAVKISNDCKKIILTTDPELIKDGILAIDDEFLKWFGKNSSCEEVKVDLIPVNDFGSEVLVTGYGFNRFIYKIIIPKEEPKQETLEEAAIENNKYNWKDTISAFIEGAKWQAERMYSEEDLREAFKQSRQAKIFEKDMPPVYETFEEWFEQFKNK